MIQKLKFFIKDCLPLCLLRLYRKITEGSEIEVLKGIDRNKFRFKYICLECRDIEKMKIYMHSINYLFIEQLSQHDFLFTNNKR